MKKRRLRKCFRIPLIALGSIVVLGTIITLLYCFVFNNYHFLGKKSVNEGAKVYKTKSCLAFYPDTKDGKNYVMNMCDKVEKGSEMIIDYALIEYGDYYLVEYGNNQHYYIDHNNNPLVITGVNEEGKQIISDYLRYTMRKAEIDEAYTIKFIEKTKPEALDLSNATYEIESKELKVFLPDFDQALLIPLKYIQEAANINLGYQNELYVKPRYISPNRKMVAFTFDDGPSTKTTPQIIEALEKYDANATFFVLGSLLDNKTIEIIKKSIENGNQYGSHTQSHYDLRTVNSDVIYREIMGPVNDIKDGFHGGTDYDFDGLGYEITIYRAPYGGHNSTVDASAPFITIEWDCDTMDWSSRNAEKVIEEVNRFKNKNKDALDTCIVLMHDIYQSTVDAFVELLPELINEGYQFVTIDDLLQQLNIDKNTKAYYPW